MLLVLIALMTGCAYDEEVRVINETGDDLRVALAMGRGYKLKFAHPRGAEFAFIAAAGETWSNHRAPRSDRASELLSMLNGPIVLRAKGYGMILEDWSVWEVSFPEGTGYHEVDITIRRGPEGALALEAQSPEGIEVTYGETDFPWFAEPW